MAHAHDHAHGHGSISSGDPKSARALRLALLLTATFAVVELVGGLVFNSLALSADAAHMFSDTAALGAALIAQRIAARPASPTHSFGWRRAEVIAAFSNGLLLVAICAWIAYAAIGRIGDPVDVNAEGLTVVAVIGLLVNLAAARILQKASGHNMNVRAAALHTLTDAVSSVSAIIAGVVLLLGGQAWIDAVISLVISVLVLFAATRLLRDATRVLLEASPSHLDPATIVAALSAEPSVERVHHMHVWSLAPGQAALSAHVELSEIETLHEAQSEGERLKKMLSDRFDLHHSTLELECHPCEPTDHQ